MCKEFNFNNCHMKRLILLCLIVFIFSCSKDDENSNETIITEIYPVNKKVRIGDTIILKGRNLDKIDGCKFNTRSPLTYSFPYYTSNTEIRFVVPKLYDEKIKLNFSPVSSNIQEISFDLIGLFEFPSNEFSKVEMIDENLMYCISNDYYKLYKSTDGGYSKVFKYNFNESINDINFINENQGWIVTRKKLFYTNDGGNSFNEIFSLENSNPFQDFTAIHFNSQNEGYLLTAEGQIYETTDNLNFVLVYDDYPFDGGSWFTKLKVKNNTVIAYREFTNELEIIKKQNNFYSHSAINVPTIRDIHLIDDNVFYLIGLNNLLQEKLFFSNDMITWEEVDANIVLSKVYFFNKDVGLGISTSESAPGPNYYYRVYETFNGGQTWIKQHESIDYFELCIDIDFNGKSGIIIGSQGVNRKHIFE